MDVPPTNDLPKLSTCAGLEHQDESGLAAQFLRSAAYSGAEAPLRALAQVADHATGAHTDAALQSGFKAAGVEAPRPAEFGTSAWMAQQVGGAVGMMVPFLALRSGIKYGAGKVLGPEIFAGSLEAGTQTLGQAALREAALSGATGFVYGSLLTPSKDANVGTTSFLTDRLKNGLADGASFAAMGAASPYVSKGLEKLAGAIESSSLLPAAARGAIGETIKFPLVAGMISGVPSGAIAAEANALKDGRLAPTGRELKETIASMSVVGGAMGTASWLLERAAANPREKAAEQEAKADSAREPKDLSKPGPERDAAIQEAVNKAMQRMYEERIKRSSLNKDAARLPGDDILDLMDQTSVKRQGVAARNVEQERSEGIYMAKPGEPPPATDPKLPGLDIVLSASGAETTAHAGFLKAIEENNVPVGRITGVSGGSLVATLFANKFSADQIKDILMSDDFRKPSLEMMAKMYHVTDYWNLFPYLVDFKPWLEDFVQKYDLKPQDNLRIVAADAETHAPIIFEGKNYDLVTALTASTDATPALRMKPIEVNGRTAVDGFYYHPTPLELCKSPSIASKIGFTSKLPGELLAPWDYFQYFNELSHYDDFNKRFPDPPGHIISTTGLPDVAMSTFSISKDTAQKLIDHGYEATMERLRQPDAVKIIQEAQKAAERK